MRAHKSRHYINNSEIIHDSAMNDVLSFHWQKIPFQTLILFIEEVFRNSYYCLFYKLTDIFHLTINLGLFIHLG